MNERIACLDLESNANLYSYHVSLLDVAAHSIKSVMRIQGYNPRIIRRYNEVFAQDVSAMEYDMQKSGNRPIDADEYLSRVPPINDIIGSDNRGIIFTTQELSVDGNEVLGHTTPDLRFAVVSLAGVLKGTSNFRLQKGATGLLARREYAIMEGLEPDMIYGDIHRVNPDELCAMSKANNASEILYLASKISERGCEGFCLDCVAKLVLAAKE